MGAENDLTLPYLRNFVCVWGGGVTSDEGGGHVRVRVGWVQVGCIVDAKVFEWGRGRRGGTRGGDGQLPFIVATQL